MSHRIREDIKNDKDFKNVKSNLGLTQGEFLNVYQAADTGDEVRNLDEWYHELHHAVGVNKQYLKNFTKNKLKKNYYAFIGLPS